MPLYAAYGSNLDPAQMTERCPHSPVYGTGWLEGWLTWETQDRARDIAAARAGWEKAKELIRNPDIRLVLLDEINIALRYDYLDVAEVVTFLSEEKPPLTHVVLTGRNAKEELIAIADLVTEMTLVKHPFRSGIKAQPGVEF